VNVLETIDEVKRNSVRRKRPGAGVGRRLSDGAPSHDPIAPRHRLVTTKYNPAPHLDAENAVASGELIGVSAWKVPAVTNSSGPTCQM